MAGYAAVVAVVRSMLRYVGVFRVLLCAYDIHAYTDGCKDAWMRG